MNRLSSDDATNGTGKEDHGRRSRKAIRRATIGAGVALAAATFGFTAGATQETLESGGTGRTHPNGVVVAPRLDPEDPTAMASPRGMDYDLILGAGLPNLPASTGRATEDVYALAAPRGPDYDLHGRTVGPDRHSSDDDAFSAPRGPILETPQEVDGEVVGAQAVSYGNDDADAAPRGPDLWSASGD